MINKVEDLYANGGYDDEFDYCSWCQQEDSLVNIDKTDWWVEFDNESSFFCEEYCYRFFLEELLLELDEYDDNIIDLLNEFNFACSNQIIFEETYYEVFYE